MITHWLIPVEPSYVALLGRATYNFAYLEWGIVWLCEKLRPGFLSEVGALTGGGIAQKFSKACATATIEEPVKARLVALASHFEALVVRRNQLLHGNPATAEAGEQRLFYSGRSGRCEWDEAGIEQLARAFQDAAIEAGDLLHNHLMGER